MDPLTTPGSILGEGVTFEVLFLPPLRERREDIPLLANHFAARMILELGREGIPEFTDETMQTLLEHPWPGNVRELKNVVERAVYLSDSCRVEQLVFDPFRAGMAGMQTEVSVPPTIAAESSLASGDDLPLPEAVRALEIRRLRRVLAESRYNQKRAAVLLGLTYHQFRGL